MKIDCVQHILTKRQLVPFALYNFEFSKSLVKRQCHEIVGAIEKHMLRVTGLHGLYLIL